MDLTQKHCVPCEGGTPSLTKEQIRPLLANVPGWLLIHDQALEKQFVFKDFKKALAFVNKVGEVAEREGHHPDICLQNWNKVTLTFSTHAIGGLSENDFILAAKVNKLQRS